MSHPYPASMNLCSLDSLLDTKMARCLTVLEVEMGSLKEIQKQVLFCFVAKHSPK